MPRPRELRRALDRAYGSYSRAIRRIERLRDQNQYSAGHEMAWDRLEARIARIWASFCQMGGSA